MIMAIPVDAGIKKWSEALTKKPTVFSSDDVHDDLSV
jgi:hypothetical protein